MDVVTGEVYLIGSDSIVKQNISQLIETSNSKWFFEGVNKIGSSDIEFEVEKIFNRVLDYLRSNRNT